MPRTPSVRYFASRNGYFTQFRGRQHRLATGPRDEPTGPTYQEALRAFARILGPSSAGGEADGRTVETVVSRYLLSLDQAGRGATLEVSNTVLIPALDAFGELRVADLKPHHVQSWLAGQATWNDMTRHTALARLLRALNWAKKQGLIATNPIHGIEKPEVRSRGKDVVLPEGLMDVLVGSSSPETSRILRFLRGTGCRPGEAVHARASHYRPSLEALVMPWQGDDVGWRWKNARKTRRDRIIFLPPDLREAVEVAIAKRPCGYIFVTPRGRDWRVRYLAETMLELCKRRPILEWCAAHKFDVRRVMPYGFRHTYATNMIARGVPIKVLADWMGTSVLQLERTYSHVHDDLPAMLRLFKQFACGGDTRPPSPSPSGGT